MTDPTLTLNTIRDNVVLPIAARVPMVPELAAAWWQAPMLLITCRPPVRAELWAWTPDGPARCGGLDDLPDESVDALAQFLSDGLRTLGADAHDDVVSAIEAERGDIVLTIRPDKGEVLASLVARGDAAKPITLFGVRATDEVRH